jgi:hypothetical protein
LFEQKNEKWLEYNLYKKHQLYDVSDNLKKDFVRIQKYWKTDYARNILLYLDRVKREVLLSELEKELGIHRVALYRWVKSLSGLGLVKYKSIGGRKSFLVSSQVRIKTVGAVDKRMFIPRSKSQDIIGMINELLEKSDRALYLTEISEKTGIPLSKLQEIIAQDTVSPEQKFEIVAIRLLKKKLL